MRSSGPLTVLFALAISLWGSADSRPEIRGLVVDPGGNQPVADAEVTVEYYGPRAPDIMPSPPKSTVKVTTDATGRFTFLPEHAGYFYLRVKKAGYSELQGMPPAPSSAQSVTLTEKQPVKSVSMALSRPGRITGRVLDEETRAPVANVQVLAWSVRQRPRMTLPVGKAAASGPDGDFTITDLAAGDYVVGILPRRGREERVLARFSEADVKEVDQDFKRTFWPGGHGLDTILPVTLAGGETVHIGAVAARLTGWYRVLVRFPGVDCRAGDKIIVTEFQRVMNTENHVRLGEIPCRESVLVAGFPPGSYRLMFGLTRTEGDPERASVPFEIGDKNVEIVGSFETPVTVEGAFVAAEGSRLPDLSKARVSWDSMGGKTNTGAGPIKPDKDGRFRIPTFLSEGRRLEVYRLGAGAYVKEIRYNGAAVEGDFVPLNTSAMVHSLTIVLDDRPAAITGVVTNGGKPAEQAVVIVARWPLGAEPVPDRDLTYARTDASGKFQSGGLAPGEYRAVALTRETMMTSPSMERLRRALEGTAKIELSRGGFQNLTLTAAELR